MHYVKIMYGRKDYYEIGGEKGNVEKRWIHNIIFCKFMDAFDFESS